MIYLGSLCAKLHEPRRQSQEEKEQPGVPIVVHHISLGQSEVPPKGLVCLGMSLLLRQPLRQGSRHHGSGHQRPVRLPRIHGQCPAQPSNVDRCLGGGARSLPCPRRYVNRGKKMFPLNKPRVPQLETQLGPQMWLGQWQEHCRWVVTKGWALTMGQASLPGLL